MASSADKLAAARLAVERAFVPPPPEIPERMPRHDERPASSGRLIELARSRGFTTRELFSRSTLPPTWRKLDPDDVNPTYAAKTVDLFRVGGLIRPLPLATRSLSTAYLRTLEPGELVAFEVVWIDGRASHARALLASRIWSVEGVNAITARLKAIGQ